MPHLPLDQNAITKLVHEFYDDIRADDELAPIFNLAIGPHWESHLDRMVDFWCTVTLGKRGFQGNVYGKHMALSGVEPEHFRRWLALFESHTKRLFSPDDATEFQIVARRIAASLQYGFFGEVKVS